MTRILGIDPGSRITGFGIIECQRQHSIYITSGCIRMQHKEFPLRLQEIYAGITEIVTQYHPTELAIEQVFMSRNVASALKLGHARGVAIVSCVQHHLSVYEYAPTAIKLAVVGKGHAKKIQVQHMVKVLLSLANVPQEDAADALAAALCHAHQGSYQA
ncbi:MAG: crossover junction endodeoxyribonuclease RuvC [Thiomargarita sp.]|nr:crossover junction endodeoxyribonuclease RuvC [Thiomargarita sp.]